MSRTKGAKGKPKNPEAELAKVRKLFADRGFRFPSDGGSESPDIPPGTPESGILGEDVKFKIGKDDGGETGSFTCGKCGKELPGEVSPCPECGVTLNWK